MLADIKTGLEGSDAAYSALKIFHSLMRKEITPKQASDQLLSECGVASQVLLSEDGEEVGIRVLPDLTTSNTTSFDWVME